jgi:hypothetical protein
MPSDHLGLLKQNMNRFYENMGIYSSIRSSAEFDAMSQFSTQAYEFRDRMTEALKAGRSLREVFEWRDGPYRDYRAAKK